MKILTIIALIGSILSPIKSDRYKNSINNTGSSSFNNFVQITYEYYCEEPSYTVGLSAGVISGETQVPLIYSIKLNIKLRNPVNSAYIKLKFTSPLGTSPYWEIPALCENAKIDYVDDDDLYVYLYNTDYASIYIVYTYEQVMKRYGYQYIGQINALDPMSPEWIEDGYTYCDLISISLESATLSTSPDYSSQLNSIMSYTDGIENYLSQIVTNTAYLSTISTNISSILSTLNTINSRVLSIYNTLNYSFLDESLYSAINQSLLYRIDDISSLNDSIINTWYESDYVGGTGPGNPVQYLTVWDSENHINDTYDKTKLKIVLTLNQYGDTQYYFVNVPTTSTGSVFDQYITVLNAGAKYVYKIQISFSISDTRIAFFPRVTIYNLATGSTVTNQTRANVLYSTMLTNASLTTNQKIDDLINVIQETWGSDIDVDMTNKNTVDSFFEELRQSLTLPSIPQSFNDTIFEKMSILLKPYASMVMNFVRYRNVLMIASLFTIIGVILL